VWGTWAAEGRLLTVRAAAAILGVSRATLYKLCERGELKTVRVSNSILIAPAELRRLVATGDGRSWPQAGARSRSSKTSLE
jgi:excisionase family DNA binding protein